MTLALSRAPFSRKRKRTNNRAQYTTYSRTYHIAQWSSRLDWSKFVYRDEYRNDKKCCFLRVFVKKIHIKQTNLSKLRLLMTIITLHHLCFGHCVNSSVIVLDLGIFLRELVLPQKNTSVQNNHLRFHTVTSKQMVCSYYCLISENKRLSVALMWT